MVDVSLVWSTYRLCTNLGLKFRDGVIVSVRLVACSRPVTGGAGRRIPGVVSEADQPEEKHDAAEDEEGGGDGGQEVDGDVAAGPVEPRHLLQLLLQLLVIDQRQESAQRQLVAGGRHLL